MSASSDVGVVGSTIIFTCSSDLDPVRVEWYRKSTLLTQTSATTGEVTIETISTYDEGAVYTCSAVSQHGSQERNVTLNVTGNFSVIY